MLYPWVSYLCFFTLITPASLMSQEWCMKSISSQWGLHLVCILCCQSAQTTWIHMLYCQLFCLHFFTPITSTALSVSHLKNGAWNDLCAFKLPEFTCLILRYFIFNFSSSSPPTYSHCVAHCPMRIIFIADKSSFYSILRGQQCMSICRHWGSVCTLTHHSWTWWHTQSIHWWRLAEPVMFACRG